VREAREQTFFQLVTLNIEMRAQAVAPTSDQALAGRIVGSGDESAFRELYRRHTPRLYQFVLRVMGGDELEAEDIVQEAWIRATRNLSAFRWESRFGTWLTGIGLNLCRNRLRTSGRWTDLAEDAAGPAPPDSRETRIDLERAIALLAPGHRAVLILHDIEGFKHAEIAETLGVSEGTSKSQLFSARRAMRRLLNPPGSALGEAT
jgi:RNA polymerase sigma-70 factor (ECF subfamily)